MVYCVSMAVEAGTWKVEVTVVRLKFGGFVSFIVVEFVLAVAAVADVLLGFWNGGDNLLV